LPSVKTTHSRFRGRCWRLTPGSQASSFFAELTPSLRAFSKTAEPALASKNGYPVEILSLTNFREPSSRKSIMRLIIATNGDSATLARSGAQPPNFAITELVRYI
jgi:hypothetical protein